MQNQVLTLSLFGEYVIKEISPEEFNRLTNHERNQAALTQLLQGLQRESGAATDAGLSKKAKVLLTRYEGAARSFGIYLQDEYAGYVSFAEYACATPEIQIELQEKHRNKGIGYAAISLLTSRIFAERQDVEYFLYRVRSDNVASTRLIEKLGGKKIERGEFIEKIIKKYHLYRHEEDKK